MASDLEAGDIRITGLKELNRKLQKLKQAQRGKALRSGLMGATLPMVKAAKANAVSIKDSGALAESIGRFSRIANLGGLFGTFVTVRIGPRARSKKALALWNKARVRSGRQPLDGARIRHGHLVEFGTVDTPAKPFLRPAFDSTREQVVALFSRKLAAAIKRQARRR